MPTAIGGVGARAAAPRGWWPDVHGDYLGDILLVGALHEVADVAAPVVYHQDALLLLRALQ